MSFNGSLPDHLCLFMFNVEYIMCVTLVKINESESEVLVTGNGQHFNVRVAITCATH